MSPGETNEAMERAREACRLLADQGRNVTARAVQVLAGCGMATAAQAAKEFNDAIAARESPELLPVAVIAAAETIWNRALAEAEERSRPELRGLQMMAEEYRNEIEMLQIDKNELRLEVRRLEAVQAELVADWQQLNVAAHEYLSDKHAAQRELAELKGEEFDAERLWIATPEELAAKQHERPAVLEYSQDEDYLEQFDKDMSEGEK